MIIGVSKLELSELIKRVDWNQVNNQEIVIFDLETTGLKKDENDIIEIGAIRVKRGGEVEKFNRVIKIESAIPEEITEITGITNSIIESEGVPFFVAIGDFKTFIRTSELSAYNAKFDQGFINVLCKQYNITFKNYISDTMLLCRKAFKLSGMKLSDVADHLGYSTEGAHRALFDCELTLKCHLSALITLQNTLDED